MKYREGSEIVEAEQWFVGSEIEGVATDSRGTFLVKDYERFIVAAKLTHGAWIVTYKDGTKFVRYPDYFEKNFKKVE